MTRLIKLELIETDSLQGNGTTESPLRRNLQLFTTDGVLVFEYDYHKEEVSMTANLLELIKNYSNNPQH